MDKNNVLSIESFVFKMIQQTAECKYLYKEYVYGCIQSLREIYGYGCEATDEEIYEKFKETWNEVYN